ncbi:hypothetical protein OU787_05245 [Kitasatospora sp. YST-16]|uniref:hypothetical protein n=1 Tax=unclassified Kitasatospora TaxID=2633591 RepID=UPI0004C438E4|nr:MULTISPECIES: hypothetical protein [unclassified Kitasatospora]WAL70952.1 hypothetical protein OU787_05245 [Kitasatospora sp. YST-16]WNW36990.1 hypothetical protein RKE32_05215 [Streptomyces sp. Li-HN-5-13]
MADTRSDRAATRRSALFSGCALRRHQPLLALLGLVCVGMGIAVAVLVPQTDGPAWVMAVAGCLAAGVLVLVRIGVALLRPSGGATS